jgi:hypothetical protein
LAWANAVAGSSRAKSHAAATARNAEAHLLVVK